MLAFDDRWIWDFWFADPGDRYHVFYLQAPKSLGDPARRHDHATIGHAVSDDLVTWTPLPDALQPGPAGDWDDLTTWTGSVIEHDGIWSLFYTGRAHADGGSVQRIGRATSRDLLTWVKDPQNPLISADPRWYEQFDLTAWREEAWRDPWVFRDPAGDGFHALLTGRARDGATEGRGVVAHARSHDLQRWAVCEPLIEGGEFGQLEVLQVERVGERWVLLFSCDVADIAPARRARLPHERGGAFWVAGPSALGPFDLRDAKPFERTDLYAMRIIRRRDGRWAALGFVNEMDGRFVGAISDPIEVPFG